ncbi:hypothetical protein [Streptomyces sp. NPDC005476]|uniref:hypothetical protein n=1 Tax=Streptomyces sp. NPDC005476 TaxID=3156882 RepID=UPI003456B0FB
MASHLLDLAAQDGSPGKSVPTAPLPLHRHHFGGERRRMRPGAEYLCRELSAQFGRAQLLFHSEQNDGEAWLIAERGRILGRWVSEYPELALGEPFGVERRLLDAYGITGKPEDLAPSCRNGFATWLFAPATSGWYPKKAPIGASVLARVRGLQPCGMSPSRVGAIPAVGP